MKKIFLLLASSLYFFACHQHDHPSHDSHEEEAQEEHSTLQYTQWTAKTECFIDASPLVKGQPTSLAIHINDLVHFKPPKAGEVVAYLKKGTKTIALDKAKLKSEGLFVPQLTPKEAGAVTLYVEVATDNFKDTIIFANIFVGANEEEALHAEHPAKDKETEITYSKEEAWKNNFATQLVEKKPFGEIIHASGYIQPSKAGVTTITAKRDGIIRILKTGVTSGTVIKNGELLFSIKGEGLLTDELEMNYQKATSNYNQSKAEVERKKALLDNKIIGEKKYQAALNQFEVAKAELENLQALYRQGANRHLVRSNTQGVIASLTVADGQFVKAGASLLTILKNKRLQIDIDVAPRFQHLLPQIQKATFVNPYNNHSYTLEELDGRILSYGKMINHEGSYCPVFFEVNNHPDFVPGGLMEAYLETTTGQPTVCVPQAAIREEMGSYAVFVQVGGESFEKRVVEIGKTNGRTVQITAGLQVGERVVTQGANLIKLASMRNQAPAHGHSH